VDKPTLRVLSVGWDPKTLAEYDCLAREANTDPYNWGSTTTIWDIAMSDDHEKGEALIIKHNGDWRRALEEERLYANVPLP
jgi:hypothetical protein